MKVSLNSIKEFTGLELPPVPELIQKINSQLGQVEGFENLGDIYKDARIVKVVSSEKHPDADKLSVCLVDDAGVVEAVERNEQGLVQVVCGAPNAKAGMWAIWLPPGSTVPATFNDNEPFVLDARKLRGVLSQGMLAAADELKIGSDHEGIVELTDNDIAPESDIKNLQPGQSFADVFGLNDTVIDIENKMFTHRPDLFGQLGVAREISAILRNILSDLSADVRFKNPDWYQSEPEFGQGDGLELEVFNDAPIASPRFTAVAVKNVTVQSSPFWLQCKLVALGAKPINNIVDATNYVMLMTAQPTHAYDYDKLASHKLGVRMARPGEQVTLLNSKTYELTDEDIVIVDGNEAIGLAGVMGGLDSEVTSETKNVVLEVANFDMYTVRKTSMRHGLFTDAVTRFTKGQSPLQTTWVLKRLVDMLPGELASRVFDLPNKVQPAPSSVHGEVLVGVDFVNRRLGSELTSQQIENILRAVNFTVRVMDENKLSVTAPFWRTDIELPEDVVEEVGRLYGFDALPRKLPVRSISPAAKNQTSVVKQQIRDSLSRAGGNEVLTYSFVHERVLKNSLQDSNQAFRLSNALSPDLQYFRLTVLPSLLSHVHANIKSGHDKFMLFELGKGHNKKYHSDDDGGLPGEANFVEAVYASKKPETGAAFYRMRQAVEQLGHDLGISFVFKPVTETMDYPVTAPFDLTRSALVETNDGVFVGMVGELKSAVVRNFKLPEYVAAATLDATSLVDIVSKQSSNYQPLSRFPSTSQDISLKTSTEHDYGTVFEKVKSVAEHNAGDIQVTVSPVSIYQPEGDSTTKTTTFHLVFTDARRTLADTDIAPIMDAIAEAAGKELGAVRI